MSIKNAKEILARLEDHERRINVLEGRNDDVGTSGKVVAPKQLTLNEIIKGKNFKSGQQKVTVIVGNYEKMLGQSPIKEEDIRSAWVKNKFDGKYRTNLLERAVDDGLVRDLENGSFDLSQTGEKFFENFLKDESTKTAS